MSSHHNALWCQFFIKLLMLRYLYMIDDKKRLADLEQTIEFFLRYGICWSQYISLQRWRYHHLWRGRILRTAIIVKSKQASANGVLNCCMFLYLKCYILLEYGCSKLRQTTQILMWHENIWPMLQKRNRHMGYTKNR